MLETRPNKQYDSNYKSVSDAFQSENINTSNWMNKNDIKKALKTLSRMENKIRK